MNEVMPSSPESAPDNIVDLDAHREKRGDMASRAVVSEFISKALHPSLMRSSEMIARYVNERLGSKPPDDAPPALLDRRQQLQATAVVVLDLDMNVYETMEQNDEPFRLLNEELLRTQQKGATFTEERKAMLALLDIRGGVIHRQEATEAEDEKWIAVITILAENDSKR